MASWEALRDYITSNYTVAEDEGKSLKLIFDLGEGRSQAVRVHYGGIAAESEWAVISTAVCEADQIDPKDALRRTIRTEP